MSAVPIPRGRPAPPPMGIDLLDPSWEDDRLEPLAELLYHKLQRWSVLHPGWWPNQRQMAGWIRMSHQTVGRLLAQLRAAGYVRTRANGGFDLGVPSPRMGRAPAPDECQGTLFPLDSADAWSSGGPKPRDSWTKTPPVLDQVPAGFPAPPSDSPYKEFEVSKDSSSTTTIGSISPGRDPEGTRLIDRCAGLFAEALADRSLAEALLDGSDPERFGLFLDLVEIRKGSKDPVRTLRYGAATLADWARRPVESIRAEIEAMRPRRAAPPPQNYNPAPPPEPPPTADEMARELAGAIEMARGGEPMTAKLGRSWLRGAIARGAIRADQVPADVLDDPTPAREKPAPGPLAKVSPEPASELSDGLHPDASYGPSRDVTRSGGEHQTPDPAPGGSNPVQPPVGGASVVQTRGARAAGAPGAQAARPAGAMADRPPAPRCAPPSDRHSDGPIRLGQRLSDGPPAPHRRE